MQGYERWDIAGHVLEFYDDTHIYVVDGIIVDSITQILKLKFGNKYNCVNHKILERAAQRGRAVHKAIENLCVRGLDSDLEEVKNFKFLRRLYNFDVMENEIPVILFVDGIPISAGRVDMVVCMDGRLGGTDIKCVSNIDKEYLFYQLNLYRIAYRQCYGKVWDFCNGLHLKGEKRKVIPIPINEKIALELVNKYLKKGDYK